MDDIKKLEEEVKSVTISIKVNGIPKDVSISEFKEIMIKYDDFGFYAKLMEGIKKDV